jgi:hypothetical protein
MDQALASHDPLCRASCNRPNGTVLPKPCHELRVTAHRNRIQLLTIESPDVTVSGLTKLGCPFEDRVEHQCEVTRRTGDDLEHLQGRRLLLPRLAQFAGETRDL